MTRLSDSNLELLRTQPQRTTLYMSIFQPRTVFKARINNASAARGDRSIPYDTVTQGTIADIEEGMTLWIGTTEGAQDVGKIRIRSVDGSAFSVSENSNVAWADDLFLTVIRYWELWSVYPRIISNPSNVEDVIFYKDYDVVYSNQNSILGTFPCAGNHQALFKGEQVYWSATGTVNLLGNFLSYDWSFEGGTPSGSSAETPGFVTYNTPGQYVTRLVISGSNGAVDRTYRYVSVYDKPMEGNSLPIQLWNVSDISGSRDEGGYKATFRVWQSVPIDENSVVVLFSEDWHGATKQSLGGNSPNNERIFFVGHVLRGSIRYNYEYSYTEFEVGSITEVMKDALGFSVSVESKASPSTWYELLDMDCRRAIYHYLKWHTTALSIADFQFIGTDYKIQFFDADRTSMYDALDNLMRNTLMGKVVTDRQGKVWMEVDARAYPNPTGSFSAAMDISKRDWISEPTVEEYFSDRLSYYEMGGIAFSGAFTGTFSALLGCAPGSAPSFRGRIETPDGYALGGQEQLNQLVGNVFANENSRLPKISMDIAHDARNMDIAPQESVRMNILPADTVRGKLVDGLYIPDQVSWRYDSRNQMLLASVDFSNVVTGVAGETIGIPETIPDDGFKVPQVHIPPLPSLTIPPMVAALLTGTFSASQVNQTVTDYPADYYSFIYNGSLIQSQGRNISFVSWSNDGTTPSVYVRVQKSGLYIILANLDMTSATPDVCSYIYYYIKINGATWLGGPPSKGYQQHVGIPFMFLLNANDVVGVLGVGECGGGWTLNTLSLSVARISA